MKKSIKNQILEKIQEYRNETDTKKLDKILKEISDLLNECGGDASTQTVPPGGGGGTPPGGGTGGNP